MEPETAAAGTAAVVVVVDASRAAGNEKFCRVGCCWVGVKGRAGEGRGSCVCVCVGGAVEVGKKLCMWELGGGGGASQE